MRLPRTLDRSFISSELGSAARGALTIYASSSTDIPRNVHPDAQPFLPAPFLGLPSLKVSRPAGSSVLRPDHRLTDQGKFDEALSALQRNRKIQSRRKKSSLHDLGIIYYPD